MTKHLTRKEKESLYILKSNKLQRKWGNPISDSEYEDVPNMTDEELDKILEDTVGQLRFEYGYAIFTLVVVLGVGWLLSYWF